MGNLSQDTKLYDVGSENLALTITDDQLIRALTVLGEHFGESVSGLVEQYLNDHLFESIYTSPLSEVPIPCDKCGDLEQLNYFCTEVEESAGRVCESCIEEEEEEDEEEDE